MAVEYLNVQGITDATEQFKTTITSFDNWVKEVDNATNNVLIDWVGKGRNQFETQMDLMKSQLKDISDGLYDVYNALLDAEAAYVDQDEAVAKEFTKLSVEGK